MRLRLRLFWDTSALLDALFAPDDSPYYDLFALGEAGAVDMRISPDVTRECEGILRPYGASAVKQLAVLLDVANFATTPLPTEATVDYCEQLTGYRNDARILAAAEECLADILVTHDKAAFSRQSAYQSTRHALPRENSARDAELVFGATAD